MPLSSTYSNVFAMQQSIVGRGPGRKRGGHWRWVEWWNGQSNVGVGAAAAAVGAVLQLWTIVGAVLRSQWFTCSCGVLQGAAAHSIQLTNGFYADCEEWFSIQRSHYFTITTCCAVIVNNLLTCVVTIIEDRTFQPPSYGDHPQYGSSYLLLIKRFQLCKLDAV